MIDILFGTEDRKNLYFTTSHRSENSGAFNGVPNSINAFLLSSIFLTGINSAHNNKDNEFIYFIFYIYTFYSLQKNIFIGK